LFPSSLEPPPPEPPPPPRRLESPELQIYAASQIYRANWRRGQGAVVAAKRWERSRGGEVGALVGRSCRCCRARGAFPWQRSRCAHGGMRCRRRCQAQGALPRRRSQCAREEGGAVVVAEHGHGCSCHQHRPQCLPPADHPHHHPHLLGVLPFGRWIDRDDIPPGRHHCQRQPSYGCRLEMCFFGSRIFTPTNTHLGIWISKLGVHHWR
jgi:hypothetical protein